VRLFAEPATDRVDDFGRLLRYVVRASDGVDVNIRLVAVGAAAPSSTRAGGASTRTAWRYSRSKRGVKKLGLWGACPQTPYDPYRGVATRR